MSTTQSLPRRLARLAAASIVGILLTGSPASAEIHVTYLWHMHQPIYYPYESFTATANAGRYNFDLYGIFDGDRTGIYQGWPVDSAQIAQNAGAAHGAVQVSFSGSLIENCESLWGRSTTSTWDDHYDYGLNSLRTSNNNSRVDLVAFPYHHALMPLIGSKSRRMQIALHREAYHETWNTNGYSKGFFPAECAFAEWMIPDLVAEGIQWTLYDNIHLDRSCENYPWNSSGGIYEPNLADVQNPNPEANGGSWVQLNGVWAPTKVSAPFGYQPHIARWIDPNSSYTQPTESRIVAMPAARYEGNESGRGGYGACKPDLIWANNVSANNDPNHPMIIVCHSDGDNYGMKNSDAYHGQFSQFVNAMNSNSNFAFTGCQDYLDNYPVANDDIVHIEPGAWVGLDAGVPHFEKWFSSEYRNDANPDRYSWTVLVAAQNVVEHADALENSYTMNDVRWNVGSDTAKAWHYLLNAEASDYFYWDYAAQPWDGNVTRGSNLAITEANKVLARHSGTDPIGPSIFPPRHYPYNPGGTQFGVVQPNDFNVFTYVYDVSGLQNVTLRWRTDKDGYNPVNQVGNEIYADNPEVNSWQSSSMTAVWDPSAKVSTCPDPIARAQTYGASITGQNNVLIDYYVEATDSQGNVTKSDIFHVFVGTTRTPVTPTLTFIGNTYHWSSSGGTNGDPAATDTVWINADVASADIATSAAFHYSTDGGTTWQTSPMAKGDPVSGNDHWYLNAGGFVGGTTVTYWINATDGTTTVTDNNSGANYSFTVAGTPEPLNFIGNTHHWSSTGGTNGAPSSTDDVWINTDIGDIDVATSATFHYSTDGGSTWLTSAMAKGTPVDGNDHWYLNAGSFTAGTNVTYWIDATDGATTVTDNNSGANYSFTIAGGSSSLVSIGNTYHWPADGALTSSDNLWFNTDTAEPDTATTVTVHYSTNGGATWTDAVMSEGDPGIGTDHWYFNAGSFPAGSTITYRVEATDGTITVTDDNSGAYYTATIEAATTTSIAWAGNDTSTPYVINSATTAVPVPDLTITLDGSSPVLHLAQLHTGTLYQIQRSSDLTTWQNVQSVTASSTTQDWADSTPATTGIKKFYRIAYPATTSGGPTITATVETWPQGTATSANLIYILDGQDWANDAVTVPMTSAGQLANNDLWEVSLGPFTSGQTIHYYIQVTDANGLSNYSNNNLANFTATIP